MSVRYKISGEKSDLGSIVEVKLEIKDGRVLMKVRNPGDIWVTILSLEEDGFLRLFHSVALVRGLKDSGDGRIAIDPR